MLSFREPNFRRRSLPAFLILSWLAVSLPVFASPPSSGKAARRIRGLEREARTGREPLLHLLDAVLWPPRAAADAGLHGVEAGVGRLTDPEFIRRVEDFFYLVDRSAGWYPFLSSASDTRPMYGAFLFYRGDRTRLSAGGSYNDGDKWEVRASSSRKGKWKESVWKAELSALAGEDDDLRFAGFGPDPETDPRNPFRAGAPEGAAEYRQRRTQVRLRLSIRPSFRKTFALLVLYQSRKIHSPETSRSLGAVFDLDRLPGAEGRIRRWYGELSACADTRPDPTRVQAGVRVAGFAGLSLGGGSHPARYMRTGLDAAFFLPLPGRGRTAVARLEFDGGENLRDKVPIPFAEYPRHTLFRGISSRELSYVDERSLLVRLAYQWRLTPTFDAQLFADRLSAAARTKDLLKDGTWCAGMGWNLHGDRRVLAGLQIAFSSRGVRAVLSSGFPVDTTERFEER